MGTDLSGKNSAGGDSHYVENQRYCEEDNQTLKEVSIATQDESTFTLEAKHTQKNETS